jgi:site-specific DNA recombinase
VRVIGYTRVSTDEQAAGGSSLQAQEQKIRLYCELHGHELLRVTTDAGASAKTLDRAGLADVLAELRSRQGVADGIVIAKLDRLTRSLRDWTALIDEFFGDRPRTRRSLFSVSDSIDTSSASGRLILNVLMTVAQWERETIGERTRDTLQAKIARGERVGKVRFGGRLAADGRTLDPDAAERSAIARMAAWRASGASYREVCRRLDEAGVPTKEGGAWRPATVRRILLRSGGLVSGNEQESAPAECTHGQC